MALLTPISPSIDGTTFTPAAAAAGGDQFPNDGDTLLYLFNGGGGNVDLTITAKYVDGDLPLTDQVLSVLAGTARLVGPFPPRYFNDANGLVSLGYSGVVAVTVLAIRQK